MAATHLGRQRGVHPRLLYRWRDGREITELSRGVFRRADAPPASYADLLAVGDPMRLRHRLGEPLAHAALHRYLRHPDARPGELPRLADALGAQGPVQRVLDVATAG